MDFIRNGKTPHFSLDELKQIYAEAPKKETRTLRQVAEQLYPGRDQITYENLYLGAGPGRAFKHNGDSYENPKYMLVSHPVMAGVMEDGTIYEF